MNGRVILMTTAAALALAAVASSARADALVDDAKAVVEKATARADKWEGPTSGPKAVAKKTVVYVAGDMRNGGILGVAHGLKEASDVLGWTYREIDGQGTVSGQASGLSQAIALKPDAIVVGGSDAVQQKAGLDDAANQGIVIVGWHAGPKPGPMDGAPVFANVTTDAMEVAKVAAMKAIADSNGKAGVVVFADSAYAIAIAKGRAMESWIKKCEGCKVLAFEDTPLAEATIAGMSVGMAAHGLKPVAEIQFMGFIYPALDQIVNHMSRMRYRTRGRLTCPVVIRTPHGGGIHAPEHHSESTETLLCHIPGIRVVCPSSPARAYGLLLAAIRDPDPVMFLEPARLYRAMRQEVADDGLALPLDRCFILREGSDVTLVTWGAMTVETLRAAVELDARGISAEVIDLATLSPIDSEAILASVAKTGRLVIVHEAARNVGVGAEIAAIVAEHGLYDLAAPIQRVAGFDTVMPLFKLEHDYIPGVQRIVDAARLTLTD